MRTILGPPGHAADTGRASESLGDVWAATGDTERTRGYAGQALEKSGGNPGLREKIAKLGG